MRYQRITLLAGIVALALIAGPVVPWRRTITVHPARRRPRTASRRETDELCAQKSG